MSFTKWLRRNVAGDPLSTYGAEPSTCLRPGCNYKCEASPPNDVVMLAPTTLALLCLGDEHYLKTGRWMLRSDERASLLKRMDTTSESTSSEREGNLSIKDFEEFCSKEENRQWVLNKLPSSAHGLACFSLMKRAMEHFDKNGDKVLDEAEWNLFLDFCAQLRLRYLQQMALVGFRAYFGRGQTKSDRSSFRTMTSFIHTLGGDSETLDAPCTVRSLVDALKASTIGELEKTSTVKNTMRVGMLVKDWRGWCSDLYYYSANVHPLHGIWACCANNRLDRDERLVMEIAVICFCYWMSFEQEYMSHHELVPNSLQNKNLSDLVFVTIPSMVMYYILLLLFTTPRCGTVDESSADKSVIRRARMVSTTGDILGNVCVVGLLAGAVYRIVRNRNASLDHASVVLGIVKARVSAYVIAWALMLGVYFNPFFAWGSTQPHQFCLGDIFGLGQWTTEKRKVSLTTLILPERALSTSMSKSITIDDIELAQLPVPASAGQADGVGVIKSTSEADVKLEVSSELDDSGGPETGVTFEGFRSDDGRGLWRI